MHLWLKALTVSLFVGVVSCDGDDCAKTLDTFATCVLSIRKDKDVQDLMSKKLDIMKDCGAKDTGLKCFKSKNECQSKAEDKAADSSERKDALKDASKCFSSQTKNPFDGLEDVFDGLNFFGPDSKHHHPSGPPPPPGKGDDDDGPPPPPGAESIDEGGLTIPPPPGKDDDGPPPPKGSPPPPPHKGGPPHPFPPPPFILPDECKAVHEDKTVMNCTMGKIVENANLAKIIKGLKDKLKDCKLSVKPECRPKGPGIFRCLMNAYKPTIKLAVTSYKDCMDKAGYKVPEFQFPKVGEEKSSSSNSTAAPDHDHD